MGHPRKQGRRSWWAAVFVAVGVLGLVALEDPRVGRFLGALLVALESTSDKSPDRYTVPTAGPSGVPPAGALPPPIPAVARRAWHGDADAWFVYPTRGPGLELCDEVSWHLLSWSLAMGTTYALGTPCLDPVQVEESQEALPRASTTGALPRPEEVRRIAGLIGARHTLIPAFEAIDDTKGTLRVYAAHASSEWQAVELVALPYRAGRDGTVDQVLGESVPRVLAKLGLEPRVGGAANAAVNLLVPPASPRELFARMERRAKAAGSASPWSRRPAVDVDEWIRASFDRTVLGNYLAAGRGMPGPWLTLNAAAVLAAARALEPERRDLTLASALALLSLRRARAARELVAPLVLARDAAAIALDAAARSDPDAITPAQAPYLYVLACGRAGDARRVAAAMDRLGEAGLPKEYARCGFVSEMDVSPARQDSMLWLVEDHVARAGAMAAMKSFDAREIVSTLFKSCIDGADRSVLHAVAPMNAITFHLDEGERFRTRLELCAIPATEYARVAVLPWGHKTEAKATLDATSGHGLFSSAWAAASHDFTAQWSSTAAVGQAAGGWHAADRMNPYAQEARFRRSWFDGPLPAGEFTAHLWDMGAADVRLTRRRAHSISDAKTPRRSLPHLQSASLSV